jgi:hypothetical protein
LKAHDEDGEVTRRLTEVSATRSDVDKREKTSCITRLGSGKEAAGTPVKFDEKSLAVGL